MDTADKDIRFLDNLIYSLKGIDGVSAVVLGGSRSRGTHHSGSDFDIGLYYDPECPPDLNQLQTWAKYQDDRKKDSLLTAFGEWGPWINGGGWLKVKSLPVDILYRDLNRVNDAVQDCLNGKVTISYQPGHPHGFVNSIYLAEIATCSILYDRAGTLSHLKGKVEPYPSSLKECTISKFLWEAEFSVTCAKKGLPYYDGSYIAGCFFRAISCLNQVLFAVNERFWTNEKGAVRMVSSFEICPTPYEKKVNRIFSRLEPGRKQLNSSVKLLMELIEETQALVKHDPNKF